MCNARPREKDSDHDGLMEKHFEAIVTTVAPLSQSSFAGSAVMNAFQSVTTVSADKKFPRGYT